MGRSPISPMDRLQMCPHLMAVNCTEVNNTWFTPYHVKYDVSLVTMNSVNVVLHAMGFYLMMSLKQRGNNAPRIYLVNLSAAECLKNLLRVCITIHDFIVQHDINDDTHRLLDQVRIHVTSFYDYGVTCPFYLAMFCITLDRYFYMVWNNEYKVRWNDKRAKLLMLVIWGIGLTSWLVLLLVYTTIDDLNCTAAFFLYINHKVPKFVAFYTTCIDILFVLLAILVYSNIFCKFYQSEKRISSTFANRKQQSLLGIFFRSRFFVTGLLVVSFICFTVIPDMIRFLHAFNKKCIPDQLEAGCYIFFAISDLFDAFIYIFVKREVRGLLLEKLKHTFNFCRCTRHDTRDCMQIDMDRGGVLTITNNVV